MEALGAGAVRTAGHSQKTVSGRVRGVRGHSRSLVPVDFLSTHGSERKPGIQSMTINQILFMENLYGAKESGIQQSGLNLTREQVS